MVMGSIPIGGSHFTVRVPYGASKLEEHGCAGGCTMAYKAGREALPMVEGGVICKGSAAAAKAKKWVRAVLR